MSLVVDLTSPNERVRRQNVAMATRKTNLDLAKKAQIESQIAARNKANKRKEMTAKRAEKRKRSENSDEEEEKRVKKKNDGRLITFTEKDRAHVIRLFHTNIAYFGNVNVLGLFCGYDCSVCPTLVYPIFTAPQKEKKQSVYTREFILGVGKQSNVITGIKQAFTELYPHLPADRVYDWQLMKWNKKAYKAATLTVAVDPGVLAQKIFSSKSFGGAANLPAIKVTDDLSSSRKMECAIDVSKYISDFVPEDIKKNFPGYATLGFDDVSATLEAVAKGQVQEKETEKHVEDEVSKSDIIQQAFDKKASEMSGTCSDSDTEEGEYSDEE